MIYNKHHFCPIYQGPSYIRENKLTFFKSCSSIIFCLIHNIGRTLLKAQQCYPSILYCWTKRYVWKIKEMWKVLADFDVLFPLLKSVQVMIHMHIFPIFSFLPEVETSEKYVCKRIITWTDFSCYSKQYKTLQIQIS